MKRLVSMLILTVTVGVMAVSCGTDEKLETLNQKLDELNQQLDKLNDDVGVVGEIYLNDNNFVDEPASFYGGDAALNKFIYANLEIPEDAVDGTVMADVIINKIGKVIDVKILKSLSPSCDAAALKVYNMLPDFKPAKLDGKPVSVKTKIIIKFKPSIK